MTIVPIWNESSLYPICHCSRESPHVDAFPTLAPTLSGVVQVFHVAMTTT